MLAAQIAVHGVAHLVRDGELAVEVVGLIEQNIGVRARDAGGVRAAALADVGVHVEPAMVEALAQHGGIILAEHGERVEHGGLRLLKGDFLRHIGDNGRINIIHVQLVCAEQTAAQGDIAVHLVEVRVDALDETVVNAHRHLGRVERGVECGGVPARVCKKAELLELRVKRRGERIAIAAERCVVGLKRIAPQRAVAALEQGNKGRIGQRLLRARAVGHGGKAEVGVVEHAEDGVGAVGHLAGIRQQRLALRGEDVRPAAADPLDGTAIGRQLRLLGVEARERFIAECKQLARSKRACAGERDGKAQRLAAQVLIKAVRGILVRLAVGVAVEPADADVQLIVESEIGQQRLRALTEAALIGGDCFGIGPERFVLGPPRLVRGEDVGEIPGKLGSDLAALANRLRHKITSVGENFLSLLCAKKPRRASLF